MCRASRITTLSALGVYLVRSTVALICPIPSSGGASVWLLSLVLCRRHGIRECSSGLPVRNKTCPDFKADPSFIYCCTSKLPPTTGIYREKHGVFCCSLADFEKERQEQADEEFHNFIKQ
ncbi:hypothetical protein ANCDUO_23392 [Ancylostoma duodenale]|uniref:Uncharacterized protein n=1 Tax=Ancylostoma duodenale TaxID=51022 RepID=A0A0C2FDD1_9BILA|nr:hypothetical protein ANCDUO_23392 [Ancylostoma duodenale]